jgi:hypothetical protein
MSSEVEIHLVCYDEASGVIEGVGSNLSTTFTDIEGNTQELASTTDSATSQIASDYGQVGTSAQGMADATDTANNSCTGSAMAMNSTALAGATLFMSFERIQNSEVALDRAHLMVERSTLAVQRAQEAYNAAIEKYGPDSQQAKDAADKLSIAQDALTVAHERASMAQNNVNNSMLMAALTVVPSLIAIVNTVSNAESIWEGIQWALNAAMDANPAAIICLATVGLVAIIIAAYNACPPFRDALNAIGAVLGGALKVAVEAITVGLTWFWQNVIQPLASFLEATLIVEVQALSTVLTWLWQNVFQPLGSFLSAVFSADLKVVSDICNFLWNSVLKPLGDFLVGSFQTAWQILGGIFQWFYNLVKPIIDAVSAVANTLGGFVNAVSGAMGGAGKAISDFIGSVCFAHALANAADSSQKTMGDWVGMVSDSMNKGLAAIKDFNAQAQISGALGVGVTGFGGPLPTGQSKATVVNLVTQGPLVNIEGSADKATADLASKQVLQALQTIIVEPTSSAAAVTQKRIRQGSVFA